MDEEEPKPNINIKKKPTMGEARASSASANKSAKPASMLDKVVAKVKEAESVLVALSNDPTVDEIAAAMGLSMALDAIGKHVTAIYSGKTPNVLEFLNPEERFEANTDSLQDFIIALNKDKADHLRYKIDGDFVKVYVTPYKTTISGDDIEFSRGDFNVDLVVSLNVPAATELDAALAEHGRIMHDATSVNITNGAAGKFGDLEWVEPKASSISEMVAGLAFKLDEKLDASTATALLTGLVAATDRFSNPATTPEAMALAGKLMQAGADQQLVAQNVQGEVVFDGKVASGRKTEDTSKLEINHGEGTMNSVKEGPVAFEPAEQTEATEPLKVEEPPKVVPNAMPESEAMPEPMPVAMPEPVGTMTKPVGAMPESIPAAMPESVPTGTVAGVDVAVVPDNADGYNGGALANQMIENLTNSGSNVGSADYGEMIDEALNEPLPGEGGIQVGAETASGPQINTQDVEKMDVPMGNPGAAMSEEDEALNIIKQAQAEKEAELPTMPNGEYPKIVPTGGSLGYESPMTNMGTSMVNPAMDNAPGMTTMEAGGVPEMDFQMNGAVAPQMTSKPGPMPMPGQEIAPPPVLPQPDFGSMPPAVPEMPPVQASEMPAGPVATATPEAPVVQPVNNAMPETVPMPDVTVQPDVNEQIAEMGLPQVQQPAEAEQQQVVDPSAFKIPGIHT